MHTKQERLCEAADTCTSKTEQDLARLLCRKCTHQNTHANTHTRTHTHMRHSLTHHCMQKTQLRKLNSACMTWVHTSRIFCLPMSKCQIAFIVAKKCPSCLCIQVSLQRNCFTDDMSLSLKSIRGGTSKSLQLALPLISGMMIL